MKTVIIISGQLGMVVRDALSVSVEFKGRADLKEHPLQEMTGYGTYNKPPGYLSDDSSLAFCTAKSLIKGYDPADMAEKFLACADAGYRTPGGRMYDIGISIYDVLDRIRNGTQAVSAGSTYESENGITDAYPSPSF